MISLPSTAISVIYNNKDISIDVRADFVGASYTDYLSGQADTLDITLSDLPDASGTKKWQNGWYPDKGATLDFVAAKGQDRLDAGRFEIDEIRFSDAPSQVIIRALSIGVSAAARTIRHVAYEDMTLSAIINQVASKLGMSVEGTIKPLQLARVTQHETDLQFLHRLARSYGYLIKVTASSVVFSDLAALSEQSTSLSFDRSEMVPGSFDFTDTLAQEKKAAVVTSHNPEISETISSTRQNPAQLTSGDKINRPTPAKTRAQAEAKSAAALQHATRSAKTGRFSVRGSGQFRAGMNFALTGFGKLDGKCQVTTAAHRIDEGGWVSAIEFMRV